MTTCKNCEIQISADANFCNACGAKVIKKRITVSSLFSSFIAVFGWESNFFLTLRTLLLRPEKVLTSFVDGTRKKYANPFSFYAVMVALSLFVFSSFSDELLIMTFGEEEKIEQVEGASLSAEDVPKSHEIFGYESEHAFKEGMMKFQLKYWNLMAFLFLPLYAVIAFLVFRKPYNFGEHFVINTYLQAISSLLGLTAFLFSLISGFNIYGFGIMFFTFLYYCFAYTRLYKLSIGQLLLRILKFIGILAVLFIIPVTIGIIGAIVAKVGK